MIAHLRGTVAGVAPDGAVIEVGGVGMRVQCTPGTLATLRPGESAQVATSLVVREDSLTLFGFASDDERNVFELLQTASGVGPRLALAMLAVHAPDALRRAVSTEDLNALTMVPGIGKKGAQRIVLEMKDRLGPPGDDSAGLPARAAPPDRDEHPEPSRRQGQDVRTQRGQPPAPGQQDHQQPDGAGESDHQCDGDVGAHPRVLHGQRRRAAEQPGGDAKQHRASQNQGPRQRYHG